MTEPIIRIRGEKVHLALMRTDEEALLTYLRWLSDEDFNAWIVQSSNVLTYEGEKKWAARQGDNQNSRNFNIIDADTNDLVGNCSIRVNDAGTSAVLGILIGERSGRDRGLGTETMRMLRDFAFENLRVHRVELGVMDDNLRARRCYEKVGFHECGCQHELDWYHGEWHDSITMEILYDEWLALKMDEVNPE